MIEKFGGDSEKEWPGLDDLPRLFECQTQHAEHKEQAMDHCVGTAAQACVHDRGEGWKEGSPALTVGC